MGGILSPSHAVVIQGTKSLQPLYNLFGKESKELCIRAFQKLKIYFPGLFLSF